MKLSIKDNIILFLLLGLVFVITKLLIGDWLTDDAFISFRYAENFVNGEGLVYNTGEYVQGYTNFLWVILLAFSKYLGFEIASTAVTFNLFAGFLLSAFVFKFIALNYNSVNVTNNILAVIFALSAPPFLCWTVGGGMEAPLFTFLLFMSYYYLFQSGENRFYISAVFLVLTTLTRPEGVLFFAVESLILLIFFKDSNKKGIMRFAAVYIAGLVPYLIWVYYYYGDLLPNTFYAKVTFGPEQIYQGIKYLYEFFLSAPYLLLILVIFGIHYKNSKTTARVGFIFILAYLIYVALVGGDFMFAFRFLVPISPFVGILLIDVYYRLSEAGREESVRTISKKSAALIGFMILFNISSVHYFYKYAYNIKNYRMVENGKITAEYFNSAYGTDYTIASSGIGALGYYTGSRIIDILGLTDTVISRSHLPQPDYIYSHSRSDADYIIRLEPEIIIFGMCPGSQIPVREAEKEIYKHKKFRDEYLYIESEYNDKITVKYYLRKDIVNE